MDFSKLDSGIDMVCLPGSWGLSQTKPVVEPEQLVKDHMTMADLLDATCPKQKAKVSPAARFEIPKVTHISPELHMELAAIRLRRFAHKDKFMRSADSKTIPTRFQIGTMIGGGLQAVGGGKESQAAGTANRKRKSGKSHLLGLLHDDSVKDWLHKNIQKRTNVARPKSKHPKGKHAKRH
jgi:hypothetical protein